MRCAQDGRVAAGHCNLARIPSARRLEAVTTGRLRDAMAPLIPISLADEPDVAPLLDGLGARSLNLVEGALGCADYAPLLG